MPNKIESIGTYRGTIIEHSLGQTKKKYPQFVARLLATEKYVESPDEIKHFQTQGLLENGEPGWVDWSSFGQEIVMFAVLYNNEIISPNTELLNVKQLNAATGWEAPDFDSLNNSSMVDMTILFRVSAKKGYTTAEGVYKDQAGEIEVSWIDNKDASPTPQLKALNPDEVSAIKSRVSGYSKSAKPAKPAKPATSVASPSASPASATTAVSQQPSVAKKEARKAPTPPPATKAPTVAAAAPAGPPAEVTKDEAWDYINARKGTNEDEVVADTWLSVIGEVAGNRQESDLTTTDWAKVRDTVCKDLAI